MRYGLDFGTSNSAVSFNDGKKVELLPIENNSPTPVIMPSLWYFEEIEKKWYFGTEAFSEYKANGGDGRFIQTIKKLLTDSYYTGTHIGHRFYSLEKLVELYFREVKCRADKIVGKNIEAITIGKPARFTNDLNENIGENRLRTAAENAGFKDIKFVMEPLAATYSLKRNITEPITVFTIDIGGGTTDVSIVYLVPQNKKGSRVMATNGISVGGVDFTSEIMKNRLLHYFGLGTTYKSIFGKTMPFPRFALRHTMDWYNSLKMIHNRQFISFLKEVKQSTSDPDKIKCLEELVYKKLGLDVFLAIESAKIDLSEKNKSAVEYHEGAIAIEETIERNEFEGYLKEHAEKISQMIDDTFNQIRFQYSDIDDILMVGGSSRIPLLRRIIREKFPTTPMTQADIFASVAHGLSVEV